MPQEQAQPPLPSAMSSLMSTVPTRVPTASGSQELGKLYYFILFFELLAFVKHMLLS
jgi:hypothetical protein